ncbi:MAG: hypothetical protein HOM01_14140, partial [Kordiimonadaceae bacterium]|nr:hypothetical protein [Kordiimonadaceae bacterium]
MGQKIFGAKLEKKPFRVGKVKMVRFLIVIMSLIFLSSSVYGQEKYIYKVNSENEVEETNDPESNGFSSYYGGVPHAVKWIPYESPCIDCEALVTQYNDSMQDLLEIRSWDRFLVQSGSEDFRNRTRTAPDPNATEAEMAQALSSAMATQELLDEKIPELKRALAKLEKTVKYLRAQIALCEQKCKIPYEKTIIGRMPLQPGEIRIRGEEAN